MSKALCILLLLFSSQAVSAQSTFNWINPSGGFYDDAANWTGAAGFPDSDDTAIFDLNNQYSVTLRQDENVNSIRVTDGIVGVTSETATRQQLRVGGGGIGSVISDGGILRVSTINRADLTFDSNLFIGSVTDGEVILLGGEALLNSNAEVIVGAFGGDGLLDVGMGAVADLQSVAVGESSLDNTRGLARVRSGGTLTAGNVNISTSTTTTGFGDVLVTGAGSTFTQDIPGATFAVGNSSIGNGVLTVEDSGAYTTGDGAVTLANTGTVNVNSGGTFTANGFVTKSNLGAININGGTFVANSGIDTTAGPDGLSLANGVLRIAGGVSTIAENDTFISRQGFILRDGSRLEMLGEATVEIRDEQFTSSLGEIRLVDQSGLSVREGSVLRTSQLIVTGGTLPQKSIVVSGEGLSNNPSSIEAGVIVFDDFFAELEVRDGGSLTAVTSNFFQGNVVVSGEESIWTSSVGELNIGSLLLLEDGGRAVFTTALVLGGGGVSADQGVALDGGTLVVGGEISGTASIDGPGTVVVQSPTEQLVASPNVVRLGGLFLDTSSAVDSFALTSTFNLSSPAIVESGGRLQLGGGNLVSTMLLVEAGGTLANVQANSSAPTRVIAEAGSTIAVEAGSLDAGDANAVNGFYSNGTSTVAGGTRLALLDANDAVFDSGALIELGESGSSGTLQADNGLTLDFGGNVTGFGTIETPDDQTKPFINNGHIQGDSLAEPITLEGYVKGVGTLDNAVITGTDAPGFSPASVLRGSVNYEGTLEIEIGGTSPGSEFDQLNHLLGDGVADLGGELEVLLLDGFVPVLGDSFEILTATSVLGEFVSEVFPSLDAGLELDVEYTGTSVFLNVVSSAIPGDYNGDAIVNAADYTVWRDALGSGAILPGDTTPGSVTIADYDVWRANFGQSSASAASTASVPEPTTLLGLAVLVGVAASTCRFDRS